MEWLNLQPLINFLVGIIVVTGIYLLLYLYQQGRKGIKIYGKKWFFLPYYLVIKELTRNCYIWGSTWSWKTVVMNHILQEAIEKGIKCYILDVKGDYERAIWEKALIISHENSLIDFFYNLSTPDKSFYIEEIANFIFPQAEKGDFFDTAAAQLFKHLIEEQKINSFPDFMKAIEKETLLADTYKKHAKIEELGNSARDVLATFMMRTWKFVKLLSSSKLTNLPFIMMWSHQVVIFRSIPNLYNVYATFNTIYFMLLMAEILTLPDSKEEKYLFLLDEAGTLKTLGFVDHFVSLCRSKWAWTIVASQSLSQLGQYKDNILNNCNDKVIGRLNDLEDIHYFEKLFEKLGKQGKKYENVGTLPDLHFYQIRHLEKDKIVRTKVDYFKL